MQAKETQKIHTRSPMRSKEYWQEKVNEWKNSQESQNKFCLRAGIHPGTFSYWRHIFLPREKKVNKNNFISVKVKPVEINDSSNLIIETPTGYKISVSNKNSEEIRKIFILLGLVNA
jgi:hypothetical protein